MEVPVQTCARVIDGPLVEVNVTRVLKADLWDLGERSEDENDYESGLARQGVLINVLAVELTAK